MADNKQKRRAPQRRPQPGGPRGWVSILFYTFAFALLGFYFFGDKQGAGASKELSYTKLTAYVEAGAIEKIEVTDDLQAKATVKPQSYTLVFGTQGDGERAHGVLKTQVPSIDPCPKRILDVKYSSLEVRLRISIFLKFLPFQEALPFLLRHLELKQQQLLLILMVRIFVLS